jgi:hypothetical protein
MAEKEKSPGAWGVTGTQFIYNQKGQQVLVNLVDGRPVRIGKGYVIYPHATNGTE